MSIADRYPAAELPVGGGLVSLSPLPGRAGDLSGDLARLKAWGADLVVSLVEPPELPPGYAAALERVALPWIALPIPDYGVPRDEAVDRRLNGLLADLSRGGRIAVHCMGGCGRSGMVVARLMVLAGEPAEAAVARLREVRPCAIETPAQLAWVRRKVPS